MTFFKDEVVSVQDYSVRTWECSEFQTGPRKPYISYWELNRPYLQPWFPLVQACWSPVGKFRRSRHDSWPFMTIHDPSGHLKSTSVLEDHTRFAARLKIVEMLTAVLISPSAHNVSLQTLGNFSRLLVTLCELKHHQRLSKIGYPKKLMVHQPMKTAITWGYT